MAEMQEKMMMKLICVSEGFEDAGKADLTILPFLMVDVRYGMFERSCIRKLGSETSVWLQ